MTDESTAATEAGTATDNRVVGTLSEREGRGVIRMEDVYPTDIADLWAALTQPERVARWLGKVSGDLRQGGWFDADWVSGWEGRSQIEICDAPRQLVVSFVEDDGFKTFTTATLASEGDKTRLVIEDFGLSLDVYQDHGAGWQVHVEDLLAHIEGRPASVWHDRWVELIPTYRALKEAAKSA